MIHYNTVIYDWSLFRVTIMNEVDHSTKSLRTAGM